MEEQGAPEAAWKLTKSVLKVKEQNKAAFLSPSEKSTQRPDFKQALFATRSSKRPCSAYLFKHKSTMGTEFFFHMMELTRFMEMHQVLNERCDLLSAVF